MLFHPAKVLLRVFQFHIKSSQHSMQYFSSLKISISIELVCMMYIILFLRADSLTLRSLSDCMGEGGGGIVFKVFGRNGRMRYVHQIICPTLQSILMDYNALCLTCWILLYLSFDEHTSFPDIIELSP